MWVHVGLIAFTLIITHPSTVIGWGCDESDEGVHSENITITGEDHKFPTGFNIELTCETTTNFTVYWTDSNGTLLENSTDGRITVIDGLFSIKDAIVNDTDTYYCRAGEDAESYFICVYVMPTYLREGIIILCVLGALMVIFCICLIHTEIKQKKALKSQYKDVHQEQFIDEVRS